MCLLIDSQVTFAELQEKARMLISEWEMETDNPVLVLLEDLCKEGDRISEEAKRDHEDLIQQVRNGFSLKIHFLGFVFQH